MKPQRLHVLDERLGDLGVAEEPSRSVGIPTPASEMHLVDRHRRVERRCARPRGSSSRHRAIRSARSQTTDPYAAACSVQRAKGRPFRAGRRWPRRDGELVDVVPHRLRHRTPPRFPRAPGARADRQSWVPVVEVPMTATGTAFGAQTANDGAAARAGDGPRVSRRAPMGSLVEEIEVVLGEDASAASSRARPRCSRSSGTAACVGSAAGR